MKKPKNKIPLDLQRKIYAVASKLPPMAKMQGEKPMYRSVTVKGTEVRKEDLKPGTPIIPEAMYKINQLVYVNHAQMMFDLVRRDGPQAIDSYESDVLALRAMQLENDKQLNKPVNKLKSWIKRKLNR